MYQPITLTQNNDIAGFIKPDPREPFLSSPIENLEDYDDEDEDETEDVDVDEEGMPLEEDGQPDEQKEWEDFDKDCLSDCFKNQQHSIFCPNKVQE